MAYLEEFSNSIFTRKFQKLTELWQEYCEGDDADPDEIEAILALIKKSEVQSHFGPLAEKLIPLITSIQDDRKKLSCFALLFDIQTTNSPLLWELAQELVERYFGREQQLHDKLRLVGLRTKENFQGAFSNLMLLNHIKKGNFVYHDAGWGVGEIVDCSFLREQMTVEFENVGGSKRDISFKNAYKSLVPLPSDHFLAMRFAKPEVLGEKALKDPIGLIIKILTDLGPKSAKEMKELLCGTIIHDDSYTKWWQLQRGKIKKDPKIDVPEDAIKGVYSLRSGVITIDERIDKAIRAKKSFADLVPAVYSLIRDFPKFLKEDSARQGIFKKTEELLQADALSGEQKLIVYLLLKEIDEDEAMKYSDVAASILLELKEYRRALQATDIVALRKRILTSLRASHPEWEKIFCDLLMSVEPVQMKDYVMKELSYSSKGKALLEKKLKEMLEHPALCPDTFLWYFQKVIGAIGEDGVERQGLFLSDQRSIEKLFEAFLLLYATCEFRQDAKDLVKRMYTILTGNRFQVVRDIVKASDIAHAREFLLLTSKCRSLSDHDQKILRSLASVVHPSLGEPSQEEKYMSHVIWTTAVAYEKMKEKIHHIATVEIVENAREVEEARKHGDLRENAEYKFAVERRGRLQKDLKMLSEQFQKARIITPDDVISDEVGIGSCVTLEVDDHRERYTILGPWDADTDKAILSIDSKIAKSMKGKGIGDTIDFKGSEAVIVEISTIFDR